MGCLSGSWVPGPWRLVGERGVGQHLLPNIHSALKQDLGRTNLAKSKQANAWGCAIFGIVFLVLVAQCSGNDETYNGSETANLMDTDETTAAAINAIEGTEELNAPSGNAVQFDEGDTAYVTAGNLNARSGPSPNARVVTSLSHGSEATVIARSGEWMKVRTTAGDAWGSSSYTSRYRPPPRPRNTPPAQRSYGVSCPCSGSNVCIGPRGGRYCITSGGNKRYGV